MKSILYTVLALLKFSEVFCVCNVTALSSVDAITMNKEGRVEKHYGINFNSMDSYKMIYVTKANVTELCEGIVRYFSKLEELNFIGVNISSIEKNAFQHVPKLRKLSLAVNNLTHLKSGYLNNIETLEVLYLTSNKLEQINGDSFDNMIHLKRLYLNRNKLRTIDGSWFKNCSKLELIDISHNEIVTIPPKAFRNIIPDPFDHHFVQYRLGYNKISSISRDAIDNTKEFLILRLDSNHLRELPVKTFENLKQINSLVLNSNTISCLDKSILEYLKVTTISLHIVNNPIRCECLDEFDEFSRENAMQATFYYNSTFNCKLLKQTPVFNQ